MKIQKQLQKDLQLAEEALEKEKDGRDALIDEKRNQELAMERLVGQQESLKEEEERLQDAINLLTKQHQEWRNENQSLKIQKLESIYKC